MSFQSNWKLLKAFSLSFKNLEKKALEMELISQRNKFMSIGDNFYIWPELKMADVEELAW